MENPLAGGAERTIYEIGRRAVKAGHEVDLLTSSWPGASRHQVIEGIRIHRYGSKFLPHLILPAYLKRHNDADLVIDDLAHAAPWFSPWMTQIPGLAHFAHLHRRTISMEVGRVLSSVMIRLERMYPLLYSDWPFVTYSQSSKMDLVSLGIDERKIAVINPGVDTETFYPSKKSSTPELVYFAGMKKYKRPEHVLLMFSKLRETEKDTHLTMIGSGEMVPYLKKFAQNLNLNGHVTFVEKLNHGQLSKIVAKAWVNIHCSISEGWGMTITEAASSGVPTAAYRVPGVEESIINGRTGILVKNNDYSLLSDAVQVLMRKNKEFSLQCRASAEIHSWESTASRWLSLINQVSDSA